MDKVAILFPGQGPRTISNLLAGLEKRPETEEFFEKADNILGWKLSSVIKEGDVDKIQQNTRLSQLVVYLISYIWWEILKKEKKSLRPVVFAGHSLGLFTAAVAAEAMTFEGGLRSVDTRGFLMQVGCEARPGKMMALFYPNRLEIEKLLLSQLEVNIAGINSETQVVLSGPMDPLDDILNIIKERGLARDVIPLKTAGAFHSVCMEPAEQLLIEYLSTIEILDPRVPIMANSELKLITTAQELGEELGKLTSTVLWYPSMQFLKEKRGINTFIEVGPGDALSKILTRSAIGLGVGVAALTVMAYLLRRRKRSRQES